MSAGGRGAANLPLVAGATLLAGLLVANVVGSRMEPDASRPSLQYQPPQSGILQSVLWSNDAEEAAAGSCGFSFDSFDAFGSSSAEPEPEADSTVAASVLTRLPSVTARVGAEYEYVPAASAPLSSFALENAPPWLEVDTLGGRIFGTPNEPGRFRDIELCAELSDTSAVTVTFDLFVDDRNVPLGTDANGRSVLVRLLVGARFTLLPGLIATMVGVLGGLLVGALGAYHGGSWRVGATTLIRAIEAFPALLILFLAAALSNFNLTITMFFVGLVLLPETANAVAERIENFKRKQFVEAARELGMGHTEILWREIVWYNVRPYLLVRAAQTFLFAILVEVTLSYLGLGSPDGLSWGAMLLDGRNAVSFGSPYYWMVAVPIGALAYCVITFSLLERGLQRVWDRRLSS